jgi:hypothetical protein
VSITTVSQIYDLGTRADYLEFGVGAKKKGHKAALTGWLRASTAMHRASASSSRWATSWPSRTAAG